MHVIGGTNLIVGNVSRDKKGIVISLILLVIIIVKYTWNMDLQPYAYYCVNIMMGNLVRQ